MLKDKVQVSEFHYLFGKIPQYALVREEVKIGLKKDYFKSLMDETYYSADITQSLSFGVDDAPNLKSKNSMC